MNVELVDPRGPADPDAWNECAARAGNVFATWEWLSTWWRHFGGAREPLFAAYRHQGDIVGVVPLYVWRNRPVRIARFAGHPIGDELGPACAPPERRAVAEATAELVAEHGLSAIVAEQLRADAGWSMLLGGTVVARGSSPLLVAPDGWDAFVRTRSSNFREQTRRRERKLAREYALTFRLADGETLERDLETLFSLHAARWGSEASFASRRRPFHSDFARLAHARGWARLWILELDGVARAAWYGFRFAGVESYYQAGRDPAFERANVGFVLLVHSMRAAFAEGATEYRLLRGGEEYKSRFATDDPGLETFVVGRGATGRLLAAAAARVPRRLARLVGG